MRSVVLVSRYVCHETRLACYARVRAPTRACWQCNTRQGRPRQNATEPHDHVRAGGRLGEHRVSSGTLADVPGNATAVGAASAARAMHVKAAPMAPRRDNMASELATAPQPAAIRALVCVRVRQGNEDRAGVLARSSCRRGCRATNGVSRLRRRGRCATAPCHYKAPHTRITARHAACVQHAYARLTRAVCQLGVSHTVRGTVEARRCCEPTRQRSL